jgi:integrase
MMAAVRETLMVCKDERWLITPADEHGNRIAQSDHYDALVKQLKVKKKDGGDVGRVVGDDEAKAVMKACSEDGANGARDAVIFVLGIDAGLRREEIADVLTGHIDLKTGAVSVIDGKGGKNRRTAISQKGIEIVKHWLYARQEAWPDLTSSSPLIVGAYGTGVGPQTVWRHLVARLESAGVNAFTTHDMRRTFVTRKRKAGVALRIIQAAMGHASIETTAGYDRTDSDEVVAEIGKVESPW